MNSSHIGNSCNSDKNSSNSRNCHHSSSSNQTSTGPRTQIMGF